MFKSNFLEVKLMSRQARQKSESGIYHVMLRGINQQQIFEDKDDYAIFLETLKLCKKNTGFELFAYCLMGNHVHLLLKVNPLFGELDTVLKRIGVRYVHWFNYKYQRTGHLFQDRFKSEPVEDDQYFLTVLAYIHQNPVRAGLVRHPKDYAESSYAEYLQTEYAGLVDTGFAYNLLSREEFIALNEQKIVANCLDVEQEKVRLTDEMARELIYRETKCKSAADFQELVVSKRDNALLELRKKGISIRQLSRLTGVSKGIIERQKQ